MIFFNQSSPCDTTISFVLPLIAIILLVIALCILYATVKIADTLQRTSDQLIHLPKPGKELSPQVATPSEPSAPAVASGSAAAPPSASRREAAKRSAAEKIGPSLTSRRETVKCSPAEQLETLPVSRHEEELRRPHADRTDSRPVRYSARSAVPWLGFGREMPNLLLDGLTLGQLFRTYFDMLAEEYGGYRDHQRRNREQDLL